MYLLDTDTIIYALKGNPPVTENLRKHINDPLKISVITLMELFTERTSLNKSRQISQR